MKIINYRYEFNTVLQNLIIRDGVVVSEKVVAPRSSFTQSRIEISDDGIFIQLLEIAKQIKLWDTLTEATLTDAGIKTRLREVLEDK